METYYFYLRWCREYNDRNLIDPASEKMEWHHTLPQCIFGDIRIGLWLTLKQHAIASALQTLAFKKQCHCGWHKKYVPDMLWNLASEAVYEERSQTSRKVGQKLFQEGRGLFDPEKNQEYCKAPASDKQKESASKAIREFWASLPEEEKTERATRASAEAAKKNRKKVLLVFPNGETKVYSSTEEARLATGMSTASFFKMLKGRVKSIKGFLAEYVNE
jgi:hypothetical protein